MADNAYNVLFLCTGNSARSILAEQLLNYWGRGKFRGFSAGSQPTGRVNPFALEKLQAIGYPVDGLRSKSWDEFAAPSAPVMDCIITVCDNAAGEACPVWPGRPATAHWGFIDPAAAAGSDDDKRAAFDQVFGQIAACVEQLVALPLDDMDTASIRQRLRDIGENRT